MSGITKFIALGDSLTEGLSDKYPDGSYRGWADRVADELSLAEANFQYANFAVRGKLLEQVISDQLSVALPLITGADTVVSFHAGANNILRPKLDVGKVTSEYEKAVTRITQTGAKVLLFTVREVANPKTKAEFYWNERFGPFNANVREVAGKTGAILLDANSHEVFGDPRMLAKDRLHLSPEGHRRVAQGVLKALGMPHDAGYTEAMGPHKQVPAALRGIGTVLWGLAFLVPWAIRRLSGKSSGDRRVAKYPVLTSWPINQILPSDTIDK
jgi:lysophospholipase L1-like esterase